MGACVTHDVTAVFSQAAVLDKAKTGQHYVQHAGAQSKLNEGKRRELVAYQCWMS